MDEMDWIEATGLDEDRITEASLVDKGAVDPGKEVILKVLLRNRLQHPFEIPNIVDVFVTVDIVTPYVEKCRSMDRRDR